MKGDIQDVKQALVQLIGGPEFLTVLAAIDTEKGIALPTPGPTQVFPGEKAGLSDQGYPVAEVIGGRTVYDTDSEQAKVGTHEIQVMWTHVGDDELLITAQLERLVRATRDLLWPPSGPQVLVGINATPTQFVSEEYSALMPSKNAGQFVKGSATSLRVQTLTL